MDETELPRLSYEMIKGITNPTYLYRGENYQRSGMVKKGWIIEDGIKAKVRGNYKPYYLVEINVSDTMKLRGKCTCPIGFGCKHSVAACLQFLYEPEFFINKIDTQKSSNLKVSKDNKKGKIKVPKDYELDPISVQEWVSTLPIEVLKTRFIKLWNRFAPTIFKNLLDPDYPHYFWFSQIEEISDFIDSREDERSNRWFTPLELLDFLNDSDLFIPILYNWTQSFIELAREIKQEFISIGITENEIDFDPEFYFIDEDIDEHNNGYQYGWEYDYEDENDVESIVEEYFSQYTKIFEEMAQFFGILIHEDLSDLANSLYDFGFKWFLDLNLSEYRVYGLNELFKIQRKFAEIIQSIQANNLKGKKRIDFLLQMYLKFKSKNIKENIIKELNQLSNKLDLDEKIKEIWQKILAIYKINMTIEDFSFLLELAEQFSKDKSKTQYLLKNTLLNIEKHTEYSYDLIHSILTKFGEKSLENREWLYAFIIKGKINDQNIIDNKYRDNERFLCSHCFEWFFKYYLPKGDIVKIFELCRYVLKLNPSTFGFNHYSMMKNYTIQDKEFEKEFTPFLKIDFLPELIKKRQYDTVNRILLNQKDYTNAISLMLLHYSADRAWDIINKLHMEIVVNKSDQVLKTVSKDDFLSLIKLFNKYSNESMKLNAKYRPDFNISQGVQLCLHLYDHFIMESEKKKWFMRFCKSYKRFRNLRSKLRTLKIEMV